MLRHPPRRSQCRASPRRREQPAVDTPAQDAEIREAERVQSVAKVRGRHHGARCAVVKTAEITGDDALEPARVIVLRVAVEVGVKPAHDRQVQAPRRSHRRPAQRPFGRHVHHVGTVAGPVAVQRATGGQPELQPPVAGQRRAVNEDVFGTATVAGTVGDALARTHDRHRVAARAQSVHQARHGQRHPVDLEGVRFADDADTSSKTRARSRCGLELAARRALGAEVDGAHHPDPQPATAVAPSAANTPAAANRASASSRWFVTRGTLC